LPTAAWAHKGGGRAITLERVDYTLTCWRRTAATAPKSGASVIWME